MIMYVHVCSETLNITIFSGFIGVDLVTFHFWDCVGDGPVKVLFSYRKARNAMPLHFVVLMEKEIVELLRGLNALSYFDRSGT